MIKKAVDMPTTLPSLKRNAVLKAILNLFNLFVPLLVGPYINGLLHPQELGLYNRALSEFQIFLVLGAFGIYNYGVRELSRLRNDTQAMQRMYTSLFTIGLITNLGATLAFLLFAFFRAAPQEWLVYAVLLLQMLGNIFYIEFLNEATENYRFITIKTILIRLAYLIGIFVFVRRAEDVVPYAVIVSLTILANNLASYFYVRRGLRFDFSSLRILPHLLPLLISFLIVNCELLYAQVDRVLLGPYGHYGSVPGDVTVTLYNLPFTLVGMLASVPAALCSVALPRLSHHLGEENRQAYQETLQQTSDRFSSLLLPICLGVAVVAPEAMQIYTRGVYTYGWPILVLACLGRIVYGLQFVLSSLVLYLNRSERVMTILLCLCGVVNLGLKLLLLGFDALTPLSAMGTTLAAVVLYSFLAWLYARRRLYLVYNPFSRKSLIYWGASLAFIPITLGLRALSLDYWWRLILMILTCSCFYAGVLLVQKDPLAYQILSGGKKVMERIFPNLKRDK